MNKKFFTLMAAILVGGAAMPSDAFAQKVEFSSLSATDSILPLVDGVRFYMGKPGSSSDTVAYAVKDSAGYSVLGLCDNKLHVAADTVSVFEVRNYSKADKTFELWVNGKQFVHTVGTTAYSKFYGKKADNSAADSTNIQTIYTAVIGATGEDAFQGSSVFPMSARQSHSAKTLNAYLNPGVKLSYPDVQNLVSNPFGETMIAINPKDLAMTGSLFEGCVNDSVLFVKKDDAYAAYAKETTAAGWNAKFVDLSVAVIDPYDTYNITGLSGAQGRVIKFVKGEALAENNNRTKGLVNKHNAMFSLAEGDILNEYGYLSIKVDEAEIDGVTYKPTSGNGPVYIGAYSLTTTGDSKSYVTTYDSTDRLTWAQVGAGTYANVATLLKADGPAVYNIQFTGNRPATSPSFYGRYLVVNANGAQTQSAPNQVDVTNAAAQWIVKSVGAKGRVTLLNKADLSTTREFTLYATDEANVFEIQASGHDNDGNCVQFIPVAEDNTFVELTDAQLAEEAQIVFNGSNAIAVNNINVKKNSSSQFEGTQKESSTTFNLAKAELVKKGYTYALTNGGEIISKTDSVAAQSYLLTSGGLGVYIDRATGAMSINNNSSRDSLKFVFKNDLAGKLQAIALPYTYGKDSTYTNRIVDASVLYVNTANALVDTTAHTNSADYNHVTLNFSAAKGNSLPAVCTHVYFDGTNASGSLSFNETADGLFEGTLATTPMVFWLDTANSDQLTPAFYISKALPNDEDEMRAVATEPDRMMLFNPKNYLQEWNPGTASYVKRDELYLTGTAAKAIFAPAAITGVNKLIWYNEDGDVARVPAADVECFKFTITEKDGAYVISNGNEYLYSLNGKLGFTTDKDLALVVEVEKTTVTANDAIEAEAGVQVIAGQGVVTVQGAAGKVITVANILGQTIANQVAASDNVTIAAPAGVVVVTVDGEATKVVVK